MILFEIVCSAIYTAAMEMLGGGGSVKEQCRSPDIMADAAYAILTRESRSFSGKFAIDEEILKEQGVKDFSAYNYVDSTCDPKIKIFSVYTIGLAEFFKTLVPVTRVSTEISNL